MDTTARLAKLISQIAMIPAELVQPDATAESLDIDSLALVELTVSVQADFGVPLEDGELRAGQTIAEMADYIDRKVAAMAG
jgi:acyl carrier protein